MDNIARIAITIEHRLSDLSRNFSLIQYHNDRNGKMNNINNVGSHKNSKTAPAMGEW